MVTHKSPYFSFTNYSKSNGFIISVTRPSDYSNILFQFPFVIFIEQNVLLSKTHIRLNSEWRMLRFTHAHRPLRYSTLQISAQGRAFQSPFRLGNRSGRSTNTLKTLKTNEGHVTTHIPSGRLPLRGKNTGGANRN